MAVDSIVDILAFKEISSNVFQSINPPGAMGNARNIAYGGCALGIAVNVAHDGVPETYKIYSFTGYYLGPALTDRRFIARVQVLRNTRSFITKQIQLSQPQDDGTERACLVSLADFHLTEPATMMTYSHPAAPLGPLSSSPTTAEHSAALVAAGTVTPQQTALHQRSFALGLRLFDTRPCAAGVGAQNLLGIARGLPTTQDHLPLTRRVTGDWSRARAALRGRAQHAAALAFQMDRALSFLPLVHERLSLLEDAGACSSLDFSLRFLRGGFDMNKWHLSQWRTVAGGEGRTYSECRLWDEEGTMVASMTQASILRPKPGERAAAAKL